SIDDDNYVSVFLSNLCYLADHRGDHAEAGRLMAAWTSSQLAGLEGQG
ncbi:MAG: hypothetical protein JWM84_3516, partial [Nocardioides sp.]|nr:hypothetical protein [Nocardioides sp.]